MAEDSDTERADNDKTRTRFFEIVIGIFGGRSIACEQNESCN